MKRTSVALTLSALMIFGAVGCGDDEKADDTTELQNDGDQSSDSSDSSSDDSSSDTSADDSTSTDDTTDLGDLGGFDNLEECMSIGVTYAGLALSVLGGEDAAKEALGEVDDLKTKFPSELEDDLDVVADAYATIAEEGFIDGSEAMDTDEFKEADANIQAYLEEVCGS